ncbi:MAG: hypothetical protein NTY69_03640 [Methylococcales bacterium]|nr:hypothetical protein [Methylococcales bacterium]
MKKSRLLLFVAGIIILLLTQYKVVMPTLYKVVSSDLFLVDSKDQSSQIAISTPLTDLAFKHCNEFIKNDLGSDIKASFADKPINAWSLGNYQYVINAEITLTGADSVVSTKKYACRITYNNGDDQAGINDIANWSLIGVSGIKDN